MIFILIQGKNRMNCEARGHAHRLLHALRLYCSSWCLFKNITSQAYTQHLPTYTFRSLSSSIQPRYRLNTHWHACRTQTHKSTRTHTDPHTDLYCFISSLALSFPWRVQFRWNVSFNGNGNGITNSTFSQKRIPAKVFLLDGTTRAFTSGSYGM